MARADRPPPPASERPQLSPSARSSPVISPARLRAGEWLAGGAGILLLADLLVAHWYAPHPNGPGITGWHALTILRWLLALTAITAVSLALAQTRLRAPAVPVTLAVILTVLSLIAMLALILRVLIDPPGGSLDSAEGGYVGLAATFAVFAGGVMSLRQEGILERDGPGEIPTLSV